MLVVVVDLKEDLVVELEEVEDIEVQKVVLETGLVEQVVVGGTFRCGKKFRGGFGFFFAMSLRCAFFYY